jgi:hypothetical protein
MKVVLAQPRGFCAGVVRATEIVERAREEDVINTLRTPGPVEVSTLPGREEHIGFRLPRELATA